MLKSVNRLVVVAAPSCCGKTIFLAHLARGAIPQIAEAIGVDNLERWEICDAMSLTNLPQEHIDCLIAAYAIPAHEVISGTPIDPSLDARLSIVSLAQETTFVTLLASSVTLVSRLTERHRTSIRRIFWNPRKFPRTRRLVKRLLPVYRDPDNLRRMYEWWFKYTASVPNKGEWVINAEAQYELRGWFQSMTSAPNRGMWVTNAEATYELHQVASWTNVFDKINSDASCT